MSIFYRSYSNILFPSQCLFFERAVNFTMSLCYSKNIVSPFFIKFSFKTSSREIFHKEGVSKKAIYARVSIKLKVAGLKKAPVLVHPREFCDIFNSSACGNCCSLYREICLRRDIFCKVHIDQMNKFLQHFCSIHFN